MIRFILKIIVSLPIILIKLVWRIFMVNIIALPLTAWWLVPPAAQNDGAAFESAFITVMVITGLIALGFSIKCWKESYEDDRWSGGHIHIKW